MATYNGANYIKEQVDSILMQLGVDDELIVSDDGSTDDTISILESYNDDRIKIHTDNKRKGVVGNFENALKKSKGDYIFLSDQDDIWMDNKVELCLKELETYDMIMHDAKVIRNGEIFINSYFSHRIYNPGYLNNIIRPCYLGCCMAFKRSLLCRVLPIPSVSHDTYIGLIGDLYLKTKRIDNQLIYYRRHDNNASQVVEHNTKSIFARILTRLQIIFYTLLKSK